MLTCWFAKQLWNLHPDVQKTQISWSFYAICLLVPVSLICISGPSQNKLTWLRSPEHGTLSVSKQHLVKRPFSYCPCSMPLPDAFYFLFTFLPDATLCQGCLVSEREQQWRSLEATAILSRLGCSSLENQRRVTSCLLVRKPWHVCMGKAGEGVGDASLQKFQRGGSHKNFLCPCTNSAPNRVCLLPDYDLDGNW